MKKLLSLSLLTLLVGSMTACDPGAAINAATGLNKATGDSASGNLTLSAVTKAQYIALLECYAGKVPAAKSDIDKAKEAVNAIPDIAWNTAISAGLGDIVKTQFDLSVKAGCGV